MRIISNFENRNVIIKCEPMLLTADLSKGKLKFEWYFYLKNDRMYYLLKKHEEEFNISSTVLTPIQRNQSNRLRNLRQVIVLGDDGRSAVEPKPFPVNTWNIDGVEWRVSRTVGGKNKTGMGFRQSDYGEVKIRTNACQDVRVWTTRIDTENENIELYNAPTSETIHDGGGYLLHSSDFETTIGCIKIHDRNEAILLGELVQITRDAGYAVTLNVKR